jgi:hypothetical protein
MTKDMFPTLDKAKSDNKYSKGLKLATVRHMTVQVTEICFNLNYF